MKYYWLFDWESSILFSFMGHAMLESLIMPKESVRCFVRNLLLVIMWLLRIIAYIFFHVRLDFIYILFVAIGGMAASWAGAICQGR